MRPPPTISQRGELIFLEKSHTIYLPYFKKQQQAGTFRGRILLPTLGGAGPPPIPSTGGGRPHFRPSTGGGRPHFRPSTLRSGGRVEGEVRSVPTKVEPDLPMSPIECRKGHIEEKVYKYKQ